MHHHVWRFVQEEYGIIFINNLERNRFWFYFCLFRIYKT